MDAIVISERTGTIRRFNSYNLAEALHSVKPLTGPGDILIRYAGDQIYRVYENCWHWCDQRKRINGLHVEPKLIWEMQRQEAANCIWALAMDRGDLTMRVPKVQESDLESGLEANGYVIDLRLAKAHLATTKMVKQCKGLIQILVDNGFDFYTKKEMQRLMESSKSYQTIKTRQSTWRLFRYYRPTLEQLGIIHTRRTE